MELKSEISFDDWKKVDLRVGRVLLAERVEGSEKLLKLSVTIGSETRTIISGIGKTYAPESLLEKTIILVANLAPKSLMGIESRGMLLATQNELGVLSLLALDKPIEPGAHIT